MEEKSVSVQAKPWQEYAVIFKELLGLDLSPVAVTLIPGCPQGQPDKKVRICRAILEAAAGRILEVGKANNACFGAGWHLGFHRINDKRVSEMVRKFVVEGEKLFCSYQALDNLMAQMEQVPDNADAHFLLAPLDKSEVEPAVIIFVGNAEVACRLLTLVTFQDGWMPKIKIGGPTCRMAIMYPLTTGEVNLSFFDYTARRLCNVDKDKLLISIPYKRIARIVESIDNCSAGKAKIEFPQEFREFLQKRLAK